MKKFLRLFGTIVFMALGIFIFSYISEIVRPKTGAGSDMVHSLYHMEKNTVDVLVLGSSHGYSSVQPNVLWHEQGITSFSLCSHGQSVASSYYILQEALKYQKPKVVLFESYYIFLDKKFTSEARLRQAFDGIHLDKIKFDMIEDFLSGDGNAVDIKDKLSYYIPFIKYHSRWQSLKNHDFNKKYYLKGVVQKYKTVPIQDPGVPDTMGDIPQVSLTYFEKIRELCEKENIPLVVFAAPYGIPEGENQGEGSRNRMSLNNTFEVYLAERGIPFLYYQKMPEAGIDFATDFRNTTHMNSFGAAKISGNLGEYLMENYDLEDHRGDEKYNSWEDDYELFRQNEERLTDG